MAKYRKLIKRFWTDPRVRELLKKEKFDEILILIYSITGPEACSYTNLSGIYEIHRSNYENSLNLSHDRVNDALKYINQNVADLMEYDFERHMVFVKSFYKHNSAYKTGIGTLIEDFNETYHKAPEFWSEFGEKYRERLGKILPILIDKDQQQFLLKLFDLKDQKPAPSFAVNKPFAEKVIAYENEFFI